MTALVVARGESFEPSVRVVQLERDTPLPVRQMSRAEMGSRQDLRGKTPLAHLGQEPHGRHGTPPAALPDRATPVRQDVLRVRLSRGAWPTRHDRLKNLEGIHPETLADAVANRRRAQ